MYTKKNKGTEGKKSDDYRPRLGFSSFCCEAWCLLITMCFQQTQHILNLIRQKDGLMNCISKHEKNLAGGKTVEYTMEEPAQCKWLRAQGDMRSEQYAWKKKRKKHWTYIIRFCRNFLNKTTSKRYLQRDICKNGFEDYQFCQFLCGTLSILIVWHTKISESEIK